MQINAKYKLNLTFPLKIFLQLSSNINIQNFIYLHRSFKSKNLNLFFIVLSLSDLLSYYNISIRFANIMKEKMKPGSPSLFFLIQCVNAFFGACALALVGVSIWLWKQFNTFTIVQIIFLSLGIFQFLLALLIVSAKRSTAKLRCFLFFMMILFLAQLISVIVIAATGDDIIHKIINEKQSKQQIQQLKNYLNIAIYYTSATLGLMCVEMMFVKCYIGSLRQKNNQFDYKFLGEDGVKMSLQQKQQKDQDKISEKYNKKREQYAIKYGIKPSTSQ